MQAKQKQKTATTEKVIPSQPQPKYFLKLSFFNWFCNGSLSDLMSIKEQKLENFKNLIIGHQTLTHQK